MKVESCPTCGHRATKRFFLKRALAKESLSRAGMEEQMNLARRERDQLEVAVKTYREELKKWQRS